jgi:hypothetical protein
MRLTPSPVSIILKTAVEHTKIPFALILSGERGFGSHLLGECAVSRSCFDRLSTNGSLHTSTEFFRFIEENQKITFKDCIATSTEKAPT